MSRSRKLAAHLALYAAVAWAGCSESTGPASQGEVRIALVRGGAAAAAVVQAAAGDELAAVVPLGVVSAIHVTVTAVQALSPAGDEADDRHWVSLQVSGDEPVTLDLLALPEESDNGVLLARGDLTAGTYQNLRIFFSEASITFEEEVTIGPRTLAAGTHELRVPSGEQTGVKVPSASFVIEAGDSEQVTLVFDGEATVQSLVAAGSPTDPTLQMSPVLTARGH